MAWTIIANEWTISLNIGRKVVLTEASIEEDVNCTLLGISVRIVELAASRLLVSLDKISGSTTGLAGPLPSGVLMPCLVHIFVSG